MTGNSLCKGPVAGRGILSMVHSRTQRKTSVFRQQRFSERVLEDIAGKVCRDQTMLGFGDKLVILYFILKRALETTERLEVTQSNCMIQHNCFN